MVKIGRPQRLPISHCLNCDAPLDGATGVGADAQPNPGDATVCIYCGHIMAYDSQLNLRELTEDEIDAIAGDDRILLIQKARKRVATKST